MELRAKIFTIKPEELIAVLSGKLRYTNLPPDAKVLNVSWGYEYNAFVVVITSSTFPIAKREELLPYFPVTIQINQDAMEIVQ